MNNLFAIIYVLLMVLIGIVLFSALPALTYFLYRTLRKKGKISKYIGLSIFSITTLGMIFLVIKMFVGESGFGPEYETVMVEQKLGGKLLCNSVYNADIHSWQYDVDYKYIDLKGDTIDFKGGSYYGREWKKDEQLLKFDKFLILKTGAGYGSDRVIIKNTLTDSTKFFDIDEHFVETDSLWKAQNIRSLVEYCCAETFIENINGGEISLKYKFRTSEKLTKKYDQRMITYRIDKETGGIKMINIE
jgi:hypothetical protein